MHAYMIGVSPAASFFKIHRVILSKYLSLLCGFKMKIFSKKTSICFDIMPTKWFGFFKSNSDTKKKLVVFHFFIRAPVNEKGSFKKRLTLKRTNSITKLIIVSS